MSSAALHRFILAAIMVTAGFAASPVFAADSNDQLQGMSPGQIQSAIQSLPPQMRDQLRQQLQGKSTEELMKMSPEQAEAAIRGLSPDMKAQLKAQWASMPDSQKAFLKSLNLHALMQRLQAMSGPELAMLRKMFDRALGSGNTDSQK